VLPVIVVLQAWLACAANHRSASGFFGGTIEEKNLPAKALQV
jgi:hypothetical protein